MTDILTGDELVSDAYDVSRQPLLGHEIPATDEPTLG